MWMSSKNQVPPRFFPPPSLVLACVLVVTVQMLRSRIPAWTRREGGGVSITKVKQPQIRVLLVLAGHIFLYTVEVLLIRKQRRLGVK